MASSMASRYLAFTRWSLSYQLVFRQTLSGETGLRTKGGRLHAMQKRLLRAQRDDFQGLWKDMIAAHEERERRETLVSERRQARENGTEQKRRMRRALRLGQRALFGKDVKALAQAASSTRPRPGLSRR